MNKLYAVSAGSDPSALTAYNISRDHATILKNGTFVNSQRIEIQTISVKDKIFLGYHTIQFLDPNSPRIRTPNSIGRGRAKGLGHPDASVVGTIRRRACQHGDRLVVMGVVQFSSIKPSNRRAHTAQAHRNRMNGVT